jgi:hypothetical protein
VVFRGKISLCFIILNTGVAHGFFPKIKKLKNKYIVVLITRE